MSIGAIGITAVVTALLFGVLTAHAQGKQDLSQAANDPTASVMSFQLSDWYTSNFHNLPGETANTMVFRPVIPFKTGPLNHIFRATVPFITDHPVLSDGLGDITVFDLIVFSWSWGRWGVGPVASFPTGGSSRGTEKWAAGPAAGFVVQLDKLLIGAFSQNLFTYAGDSSRPDVNVSVLQPILNLSLGDGWAIGVWEMTFTCDWEALRWSSLPPGVSVTKLVHIGSQPVQLSAQYEHDFADDAITDPSDTLRFGAKVLVSTSGN